MTIETILLGLIAVLIPILGLYLKSLIKGRDAGIAVVEVTAAEHKLMISLASQALDLSVSINVLQRNAIESAKQETVYIEKIAALQAKLDETYVELVNVRGLLDAANVQIKTLTEQITALIGQRTVDQESNK